MRTAAFLLVLLALPASSALASDADAVARVAPSAPSAVYVDGVKVGAELAEMPKQAQVRTGRCSGSGCTLILTY
ncbi:MAG: hypothetical protein H6719_37240 [Sandaracinaceae bacterium]|nr:hypothetical protein [Sandaracinaceae bacterium]